MERQRMTAYLIEQLCKAYPWMALVDFKKDTATRTVFFEYRGELDKEYFQLDYSQGVSGYIELYWSPAAEECMPNFDWTKLEEGSTYTADVVPEKATMILGVCEQTGTDETGVDGTTIHYYLWRGNPAICKEAKQRAIDFVQALQKELTPAPDLSQSKPQRILANVMSDLLNRRGLRQAIEAMDKEERDNLEQGLLEDLMLLVNRKDTPGHIAHLVLVHLKARKSFLQQWDQMDTEINTSLRSLIEKGMQS